MAEDGLRIYAGSAAGGDPAGQQSDEASKIGTRVKVARSWGWIP